MFGRNVAFKSSRILLRPLLLHSYIDSGCNLKIFTKIYNNVNELIVSSTYIIGHHAQVVMPSFSQTLETI